MDYSMNTFQPQDAQSLLKIISEQIQIYGNKANLNFIDTSLIVDMGYLFCNQDFNGDISKWDVSNVKNMGHMFRESTFNQDISQWNVSQVKNMSSMFSRSKFNGDISRWDVQNVEAMVAMFSDNHYFQGDISHWNVINVEVMDYMFVKSRFNGDIRLWNPKIHKDIPFISTPKTAPTTFEEYKHFCERKYLQNKYLDIGQHKQQHQAL